MSYFALELRPATAGCLECRRLKRLPNFFDKIRVPCQVDRLAKQIHSLPRSRMGPDGRISLPTLCPPFR